ncbi:endonuclease/exonuclease/phosphatase family protein [Microbacterium sp. USHLN186]|uniref:endonuclease/exonuclease/phosphatase family protein n=1 Tax=Microbacterium sp. USHLN186 TaxID=3081286 RepID=UPI003017D428
MPDEALIGAAQAPDLHVMTFNVRRAVEGRLRPRADRWSTRAPAVRALLATEQPTLLGLQEVRPRVLPLLRDALGDGYRMLGRGRRGDGGGEGTPLFFDDRRLQLRDGGQRALSDRPQQAGSTGWGNVLPRILVWAEFADRDTGRRFLAVNTHFDHLSAGARWRSAAAVRDLVARRGLPAVVLGDLNAGADSAALARLTDDRAVGDPLTDAWQQAAARRSPAWGTYAGYRPPREGGRRLDWILVTPSVEVCTAATNARRYAGRWPSDHLPVQAVLRIGKEHE